MGQVKIIGKKGERLAAFAEEHPVQFGRSLGDLLPPAWNMEAIRVLKEQHLRTRFNNVKGRAVTRGRMLRIANATGDAGLLDYALCDLRWQRVTSIEPDGIEHTFDFRVPGRETFVANGFVVHNSSVEQTCDKVFALWRPALTEDPDEIDSVELLGKRIPINEKLLVIRMLKQRGEQGRATWAMYFDPAYLELAELETLADRLAGRG